MMQRREIMIGIQELEDEYGSVDAMLESAKKEAAEIIGCCEEDDDPVQIALEVSRACPSPSAYWAAVVRSVIHQMRYS
jgi:hypothetical protein